MKKVLLIAPASYPVYGAESIVNIKLLKAFTNSSIFEIDLLSKESKWSDYPSNSLDELGVKLKSLNIVEVNNKLSLRTIWLHIKSLFVFGSVFKGSHWAIKALPVIKELVTKNNYDFVLTKNAPSLLLGYYIKKKYGIKWVATWNDPYPVIKYPVPYGKGCDVKLNILDKLQLRIMRCADIHIFPNNRLRDYMLKYLSVQEKSTMIVPHVVNDVEEWDKSKFKKRTQLRLIHSGNILPPRNPQNLIKAVNLLSDDIANNILIAILGVKKSEDFHGVNQTREVFQFLPPVTYCDSISILKNYDVAMIIEAPCEEGIFLPTKVSDFMQLNIPIWAISPQKGVLNDLYKSGNIPYFSNIDDVESIKETLTIIHKDYQAGHVRNNKIPDNYTEEDIVNQYRSL